MKKIIFISLTVSFIIFSPFTAIAGEDKGNEKLFADIEEYIKAGESASAESGESIRGQIEKAPTRVAEVLIKKCNIPDVSDQALSIYIWAIGFTRDANVVDELIKISNTSKSPIVKLNVFRALAKIGGNKAGDYLLMQVKNTSSSEDANDKSEKMKKFDILDCLGQMQYVPALPEMEVLLKKDYEKYYWQSYFCFGKMGDKAIPYLLEKVNDNNTNVRFNSIILLGQILMAPEAAKPLSKQYWIEKEILVKKAILSSMERIATDLKEMELFFKEVAAKEQNEELKKFAEETIADMNNIKAGISDFNKKKKNDRGIFETEYETIYNSYGKDGNIETLATYSSANDESRFKKLRERILLRNSDECFYDYEKVSNIIMINRFIHKNKELTN